MYSNYVDPSTAHRPGDRTASANSHPVHLFPGQEDWGRSCEALSRQVHHATLTARGTELLVVRTIMRARRMTVGPSVRASHRVQRHPRLTEADTSARSLYSGFTLTKIG